MVCHLTSNEDINRHKNVCFVFECEDERCVGNDVGVTVCRHGRRNTPGRSTGRWMIFRDSRDVSSYLSFSSLSALVDLYVSASGSRWIYSSNWLSGDPCTGDWFGVVCDAHNTTVIKLYVLREGEREREGEGEREL
jgi:hypothetical protein